MGGTVWAGKAALALALLWTPIAARADSPPIIFAFGDHNEAPFALIEDGKLQGGFLFDFAHGMAAALGRSAQFRFVPRNRIAAELVAGSVDAYCMASPAYYPAFPSDRFSEPLFIDQDVVVLTKSFGGAARLDGLSGARVGTVLGYVYPSEVETLFANGAVERIDSRNAETNLRKLVGGRLDAVILPLTSWQQVRAQDPVLLRLTRPDFIPIAERERRCLISVGGGLSVADANLAIKVLVDSGDLPDLLNRVGIGRNRSTDTQAAASASGAAID